MIFPPHSYRISSMRKRMTGNRKDTCSVFSEPVDPNELPDYHEIIEHPMDFGTIRKKLDGGLYSHLEELEADVYLICSNAMQYNSADTVYYRQARTIHDLARRDFENLRHAGEDGEPQPKVVRRGRPPGKNLKKSIENSPIDRVVPELSSGATLASGDDKAIGSNSYNLRKGPILSKFHSPDASFVHHSRNGATHTNNSILQLLVVRHLSCGILTTDEDMKRLMAVGVHVEQHAYARSPARFAANLGPVVWEVASKKLEIFLPAGVKFGPGWVGEGGRPIETSACPTEIQKSLDSSTADPHSSRPVTPTPLGLSSSVMCKPSAEIFEAVKRLNSQDELTRQGYGDVGFSSPAPQNAFLQPRNGFNGMFGHESSPRVELRFPASKGQSGLQEASSTNPSFHLPLLNHVASAENKLLESWGTLCFGNSLPQGKNPDFCTEQNVRLSSELSPAFLGQQRSRMPIPPDLNVRVQSLVSPSASLQIGLSQQPDLALQVTTLIFSKPYCF
ncbi:hypothetical protein RND71_027351 [Anisodus tanguticus]|uniref:Bromo domain-containing protein n=1 Tax=Anisodus tanguticus TaxID=243964 RepID=A0AAE1V0F5_9SOLA|nr:hypothetical protein RND71_027351 [Anisodus tanguticus]